MDSSLQNLMSEESGLAFSGISHLPGLADTLLLWLFRTIQSDRLRFIEETLPHMKYISYNKNIWKKEFEQLALLLLQRLCVAYGDKILPSKLMGFY